MHCNLIQKRQIENFSHPRLIFKITLHKTFSISVIAKTNANQCAAQKKGAEGPPFLLLLEALPYVVGITVRISGEKPD